MSNQATNRAALYVEIYQARRARDAAPKGSAAFEAANKRVGELYEAARSGK